MDSDDVMQEDEDDQESRVPSPKSQRDLGSLVEKTHGKDDEVAEAGNIEKEANEPEEKTQVIIIKKGVRTNGFAWPLHPQQIITYIVIILDTYSFYFISLVSFSYSPGVSATFGVIYSIIFLAVVYFAYMATKIDPTDTVIKL